jgi:hypothetical protein
MPFDVQHDGVLWQPDETEILLSNALVRQKLLEQEVQLEAAREQRDWLGKQTERLAAIALELDATERRLKMAEEIEARENWWREVSEREKAANEKILAHFQDQLDGGVHAAMVARANKAKADIDRDNARLERLTLLKRGVLRGTRKNFSSTSFFVG